MFPPGGINPAEADPEVQARLLAQYPRPPAVRPPRPLSAPVALIGPLADRDMPPRNAHRLRAAPRPISLLIVGGASLTTLALMTTLVVGVLGLTGVLSGKLVGCINLSCYGFTGSYLLFATIKYSKDHNQPLRWGVIATIVLIFAPIIIAHAYGSAGMVSVGKLGAFPVTIAITAALFACCAASCAGCLLVGSLAGRRALRH
jgi:hypothetical protein